MKSNGKAIAVQGSTRQNKGKMSKLIDKLLGGRNIDKANAESLRDMLPMTSNGTVRKPKTKPYHRIAHRKSGAGKPVRR